MLADMLLAIVDDQMTPDRRYAAIWIAAWTVAAVALVLI